MSLSTSTEAARPSRIIDLLKNAAESHAGNGFLYLENGCNEPATRVTFPELYAQAKVSILRAAKV